MRRKRKRPFIARAAPFLPPLLAAAGGLAVAVALVRRRRAAAAGAGTEQEFTVSAPPSDAPAEERVEQTWSCQCGQAYRVSGEGLHPCTGCRTRRSTTR